MKKATLILVVLVSMLALTAAAQRGQGSGPQAQCDMSGPHFQNRVNCDGHGGGPGRFGGPGGHPGMGPRHDGGFMLMRFADELELTDAQKDQLKELRTNFQMERIDQQAEMKKARLTLQNLRTDDNASEREVFAAIDKLSDLRASMQKMAYTHHQQMKDILTEEQQDKLEELRKDRRGFGRRGGDIEIEKEVIKRRGVGRG